jgi:hypothetical protein
VSYQHSMRLYGLDTFQMMHARYLALLVPGGRPEPEQQSFSYDCT